MRSLQGIGRLAVVMLVAVVALVGPALAEAQPGKVYTLRYAGVLPESDPTSRAQLEFKRLAEAAAGGRLKIDVFCCAKLGTIQSIWNQVREGAIEMTIGSISYAATYYPGVQVLALPYLFADRAQAFKALEGPVAKGVEQKLLQHTGLRIVKYMEFGFKNVINSKRPVHTLDDLRGLKLRVIPSPITIGTFQALGANPVGMDWGEVYTSIQQGVLDGAEVPHTVILSSKTYEVAKYISETRHFYEMAVAVINEKVFASLPTDLQQVVLTAARQAQDWERDVSAKGEVSARQEMTAKGARINEISPAELEKFRAAVKPVYAKAKQDLGPDAARWIDQLTSGR